MLTISRIKRFIKALEMDDDSILGDEKEEILSVLISIGDKYDAYFKASSNDVLIKRIWTLFKKGLPSSIYNEATDIIMECIDIDSKSNHLPPSVYKCANSEFIYSIVKEHENNEHNIQVVEWALGEKRYITPLEKTKTRKKKSVLRNVNWSDDNLSEEEELDEIEQI